MISKPAIVDQGKGPEIEGTRTSVYHVMDYYIEGWPSVRIAARLGLGTPDIDAAIEYIEAHRAEVDEEYYKILERCERGNPPELQAKIDARRPIVQTKMAEVLRKARETNGSHANGSNR